MGNRQLFPEKSAKELLEEFRRSGSNGPFEEIVRRYAAMVFSVCMRVTGDKHDAEDATQAVFLSLALQAKTEREIKYIGPWLQKVAHRLALDVKKSKTRRKRREEKLAEQTRHIQGGNGRHYANGYNGNGNGHSNGNGHAPDPADAPGADELKSIMMEELNQLPAKYRMPLVMHYFGGLSREEMAEQLNCNPSTLGVRVHRGKAMLGTRLAKRGITISAVAMAVVLEHVVREGAVAPIVTSAAAAAAGSGLMAGSGLSVAIASAKVIALVRTASRAAVLAQLKYAVAILLVVGTGAMATGTEIVREIRRHLPAINLDVREWVKPLFRSIVPDLRAESRENDLLALDQVTTPSRDEVKVRVDPNTVAPGDAPRASAGSHPKSLAVSHGASAPSVAKPQPTADATARNPHTAPSRPQFNALANDILVPPVAPRPHDRSRDASSAATLGSDTRPAGSGDDDAAPSDRNVASASASDGFYLGAGGGGGVGKPQVYVLPSNGALHTPSMTVGGIAPAVFRQLGGDVKVDGDLRLARSKGATATYEMHRGTLTTKREIIGDVGDASFIQMRGVNVAQDSIIIGKSGNGTYFQDGGETIVLGRATEEPEANAPSESNGLSLGWDSDAQGKYVLNDGTLTADPQNIGVHGSGTVVQTGGQNTTGQIALADSAGSVGEYVLNAGQIKLRPRAQATQPDPAILIGGAGKGSFNLGNAATTGSIHEVGGVAGSVVVRGTPTGDGSLVGHGHVELKGALVNNAQVIADGYRRERTLDLSSFSAVSSTIENSNWGGTSGWFARREGKLVLPPVRVHAGTGAYNWGEDSADAAIDLVNSVRFTVHDANLTGDVSLALLSPLRDDIPALPRGHRFIGLWEFDATMLGGFSKVDLEVRYDDALAASLGIDEAILKLWRYDGVDRQWHRLDGDPSFSRNALDHILLASASGDMSYFAVSAPEPGATVLLAAGAAMLLRRRRRAAVSQQ